MSLRYEKYLYYLMIILVVIPMHVLAQGAQDKTTAGRPWLGVYLGDYESEDGQAAHRYGAEVQEVIKGSPAEVAGFEKGDILIKMQEKTIRDADDVIRDLANSKPGDEVRFQVLRDGKEKSLKAKLSTHKEDKMAVSPGRRSKPEKNLKVKLPEKFIFSMGTSRLGVRVQEMDDDLAGYFNIKAGDGVLVTEVEEDSPAEKAGFKSGDVITRVNDKKTGTPDKLREEIRDVPKDEEAEITYLRKGTVHKVKIELDESDAYYVPMGPLNYLPYVDDEAIRSHLEKMREEMEKSRDKDRDRSFYWHEQFNDNERESLRESLKNEMDHLKKEMDHLREEMSQLKQELKNEFEKSH